MAWVVALAMWALTGASQRPLRLRRFRSCLETRMEGESHRRRSVDVSSPTYTAEAWILKSHQRQLVDVSSPTYTAEAWILKSHQRQLVDGSSPTYTAGAWILKSHQRQLVDGSSPTYTAGAWILKSHQRQLVDGSSPTYSRSLDSQIPPTAVGGWFKSDLRWSLHRKV
jgi:hypothetical protein